MVGLVIFDCDGVLVDSEIISCGSLAAVMTRHGLPTTQEQALERFLGRSTAAIGEDFARRTGRPLPDGFLDEFRGTVAEKMRQSLTAIPGIAEALSRLEAAAIPFCLASSSDRPRIELALEVTGLTRFFKGRIFNAAMVARSKPAPDLFLHAAAEMGFAPADCLVIEDSIAGIQAGRAAVMEVWGFTGGQHHVPATAALALQAAGADHIFHSMAELTPQEIAQRHGRQRDRKITA